jgi:bla regulator protein blaR1
VPQWQIAAGGKMAFDVASVKVDKSGELGFSPNIPFTLGPTMPAVGGLMSVGNVPLRFLIGFAYKLSVGQTRFLMPGLPSWVDSERFAIEARAEGNPTKDQFRLMVQSLLAERFKLAMHHETRQLPLLAIVLSKPGRTGPQLIPHTDDAKCGSEGQPAAPPAPMELAPLPCGAIVIGGLPPTVPGRAKSGGRKLTLDYIAAFLNGTGFPGLDSERLVVNRTGLSGEYDFWIEMVPSNGVLPNGDQPDPNGPTMLEALQEQLGLKLESQTGPVDVFVVDHVEKPSPN